MKSAFEQMMEDRGMLRRIKRNRGSRVYTVLITVILLIILAFLLLITLIVHSGFKYESLNSPKTCTSTHCINLAVSFLQSVNMSVDPCEDFYTFSCGKWIDRNVRRGIETSTFEEIHKTIIEQLIELFDNYQAVDSLPHSSRVALSAYRSCANFRKLEPFHFDWLKSYLNQFGGWPIIDKKWDDSNYDWILGIATASRKLEIHSILPISVTYDSNDTSKNVIVVGLFDEPDKFSVSQITNYIVAVAVHYDEVKHSTVLEDIEMMLRLEEKIISISEDMTSLANDYRKLSIRELHELIPTINWLKFIQAVTNDSLKTINETITIDEQIVVKGINFLTDFGNLIRNGTFSLRSIANLIGSNVLLKFLLPFLIAFQSSLPIRSSLTEHNLNLERAEFCIVELSEILTFAVDYIYVRSVKEDETNAKDMIPYLFKAFRILTRRSEWLDDQTKTYVAAKLGKMIPVVNYPSWILNSTRLDTFYTSLPRMTDNPLENFANLHEYVFKKSVSILRKRNIREGWPAALRKSASTVGAFYIVEVNSIVIPLGFHNPPTFHRQNPWYMNYGSMGSAIGHEITHGFDVIGCHRDENGRLQDWWTNSSKKEFFDRSHCFANSYSKYSSDIYINGNLTLPETIADAGGLRQAYLAYRLWEKDHEPENVLPGLESFTTHQLFFISYGMNWCDSKQPNTIKELLMQDDHPPNKFRVLSTVSNMKEFSKVFNCKPSSKMNPVEKCVIW